LNIEIGREVKLFLKITYMSSFCRHFFLLDEYG